MFYFTENLVTMSSKVTNVNMHECCIPVCASSVTVIADELAPYPILVLARTYK